RRLSVQRHFFDNNDDLARVRRGAVVALARHPFATRAAELVVKSLAGMDLAHPADAAAYAAVANHAGSLLCFSSARSSCEARCSNSLSLPSGKPACCHSSNERRRTCALVGFFMLLVL